MPSIYKIMFGVSMLLTVAAILVTAVLGLRLGVDFNGGSVMELVFDKRPVLLDLDKKVSTVSGINYVASNPVGDNGALVRLNNIDQKVHQQVLDVISSNFGKANEIRFDSIGPTIGKELRNKSITAIIVLLLAVSAYIAFVFRKLSKVLSSWAMGGAAIVALVHDVVVPTGVFAILGHYCGIEISAVFVAAALTILGYSLSDSVVVFDRVRENILRFGVKEGFGQTVHKSVMQTLVRSINTTLATLITLFAIYFSGGESIKYFALALILGIFSGAYSSIFIASPILVWLSGKQR